MPSAVILAQKQATVKELAEKLKTAKSAVIVPKPTLIRVRTSLRKTRLKYWSICWLRCN